jgi:hypothetical protein
MSKLRGLLESVDDGAPALIKALGGAYELKLPAGTEVDLHVAEEAVHAVERCLQTDEEVPPETMETALEIPARPFLPGESSAWVEAVRLDMRALYVRALEAGAEIGARSDITTAAVELARQVIELEPFRETGYRRLMRLHLQSAIELKPSAPTNNAGGCWPTNWGWTLLPKHTISTSVLCAESPLSSTCCQDQPRIDGHNADELHAQR